MDDAIDFCFEFIEYLGSIPFPSIPFPRMTFPRMTHSLKLFRKSKKIFFSFGMTQLSIKFSHLFRTKNSQFYKENQLLSEVIKSQENFGFLTEKKIDFKEETQHF